MTATIARVRKTSWLSQRPVSPVWSHPQIQSANHAKLEINACHQIELGDVEFVPGTSTLACIDAAACHHLGTSTTASSVVFTIIADHVSVGQYVYLA